MRARGIGSTTAVVAVTAVVALAATAVAALSGAATVTEPAERGAAAQVTDTLPPPPGCDRVVVIGDSLTDNSEPWLRSELRAAGHEAFVDGEPSRRIPGSVRAPLSGVKAALAARSSFGEADCWVVALGSNDLHRGAADASTAAAMIAEMLGAVSPGAQVWWMNVNYHRDPRTSFDFVEATAVFNGVLDDEARQRARLHVIDWYSLSEANLHWFFDPVHVDRAASIIRAEVTVDALPPAR